MLGLDPGPFKYMCVHINSPSEKLKLELELLFGTDTGMKKLKAALLKFLTLYNKIMFHATLHYEKYR